MASVSLMRHSGSALKSQTCAKPYGRSTVVHTTVFPLHNTGVILGKGKVLYN